MSPKRLVISFCSIVVLLAIAAVLQVIVLLSPTQPSATESDVQDEPEVVASQPVLAPKLEASLDSAQQASAIATNEGIVMDGSAVPIELAMQIASNGTDYNSDVVFLPQRDHLVAGCEIMALCVSLQAEGFDADPNDMAHNYLRIGGDPANDYIGEPWSDGGGYPPCIVDAANDWLAANEGEARAYNLTGSTFEGVLNLVYYGYPVAVWTTEDMAEPDFEGDPSDPDSWYFPEHVVVVYGIGGGEVFVSDSIAGLVRRDLGEFTRLYEACGYRALIVVPAAPKD